MKIEPYGNKYREQTIELWKQVFGYQDKRNNPALAIDKKMAENDGLFLIAHANGNLLGTVMGGYDGHRGWIYSLAVNPQNRDTGIGSTLMNSMIELLAEKGCMKVNLQVLPNNTGVIDFYKKNGFSVEDRISMGMEISRNIPG